MNAKILLDYHDLIGLKLIFITTGKVLLIKTLEYIKFAWQNYFCITTNGP